MKKMILLMISLLTVVLAKDFYVLCEGNFSSTEASLWYNNETEMSGPIYWNLDSNPLGSVGQDMELYNGKLFLVVNNSHKIEVLDTETQEGIATIDLPFANPRYLTAKDNIGYLSSWGAGGIIIIDMDNYTVLDTIVVGALPEDIIIKDDMLYTSINMNSMWSTENNVYSYDISGDEPALVDTFQVIPGPGRMTLKDNELYVASTYYGADWSTYSGASKINLDTKEVTTNDFGANAAFTGDIVVFNNEVYRGYLNGMVKIGSDLTFDATQMIGTGSAMAYSLDVNEDNVYIGYSDYVAPDTVVVFDSEGNVENSYQVGAIPGDLEFVNEPSSVKETELVAVDFSLEQNYPNPFNPTTNIQYNIPKNTFVKLSVYNILGKHIIDLVNENQNAGLQNVQWNALDKNGLAVPTGVYFYRLESGDVNLTRKMVLMK